MSTLTFFHVQIDLLPAPNYFVLHLSLKKVAR
jgi:hypothetical protein